MAAKGMYRKPWISPRTSHGASGPRAINYPNDGSVYERATLLTRLREPVEVITS